jgi:hypothetical protein
VFAGRANTWVSNTSIVLAVLDLLVDFTSVND